MIVDQKTSVTLRTIHITLEKQPSSLRNHHIHWGVNITQNTSFLLIHMLEQRGTYVY